MTKIRIFTPEIYSLLKFIHPEKYSPLKKYFYQKNIHSWKIFPPEKYSSLKTSRLEKYSPMKNILNQLLKIFTPEKYSLLKNSHPWKIFTPEKYSLLENIQFVKTSGVARSPAVQRGPWLSTSECEIGWTILIEHRSRFWIVTGFPLHLWRHIRGPRLS